MRKFFCLFSLLFISLVTNVSASPANDMFLDDNLYKCIIDAYNINASEKKDYTYNILPQELREITNLDCSNYKGSIENLTGLNKLTGLTSLNISGNLFLGGSLKITGASGKLKSNIILPTSLSLEDISYSIENKEIVKIENDTVYALKPGTTYVTMTAKVSGNEIKEKYLVSVAGDIVKKSNNAKLASLYLSEGEFSFDSNIKAYSVVVASSVTSVRINANVLDKKATFVSGYGPRNVDLNVGSNTLLVKVKAEDGTINTYTISVLRSDGNDSNNRLINIELSIGNIDFKPDVYIYNFTVDSNIDKIDVKAVAESSLAKVDVSDTRLKVGDNKITINVTAESGLTSKYELIVTREDYNSLDNYLKELNIKNYMINFDKNIYDYTITIGNENSLNIVPVLENMDSTYTIIGNSNLEDGSKIVIQVSDKEGSTREYNILVNKNSSSNFSLFNNINFKWILLGLEFLIIVILVLIIMFRGRPRKPKVKKRKVNKTKRVKQKQKVMATTNVCKACGAANDNKSKVCYICGNLLN